MRPNPQNGFTQINVDFSPDFKAKIAFSLWDWWPCNHRNGFNPFFFLLTNEKKYCGRGLLFSLVVTNSFRVNWREMQQNAFSLSLSLSLFLQVVTGVKRNGMHAVRSGGVASKGGCEKKKELPTNAFCYILTLFSLSLPSSLYLLFSLSHPSTETRYWSTQ